VKKIFLTLSLLLAVGVNSMLAALAIDSDMTLFQDGDRVVFAGDSITHAGWWQVYIADYYLTRFPDRHILYSNAGIAGDTANGVIARFDRDVLRDRPNRAVVMLGMNDVGVGWFVAQPTPQQQAAQRGALDRYRQNMTKLIDDFVARNITVTLATPSPYDETAKLASTNAIWVGKNKSIGEASDFLKTTARERNLALVDFHDPMTRLTTKLQQADPSATLTGPDRTHPHNPGYFVMAALFLQAQGARATVAVIDIRLPEKQVARADNCQLTDLEVRNGGLAFDYSPRALPFPVDLTLQPAAAWTGFYESLNQETLQIDGLAGRQYLLSIDGTDVGAFAAADLARGVNLARFDTPMRRAAQYLVELNHQRGGLEMQMRDLEWFGLQLDHLKISRDDLAAIKDHRTEILASPQAKAFNLYFQNSLDHYLKAKPNETAVLKKIADLTAAIEVAQQTPRKYHVVIQPVSTLPSANG
jgi:lysophospholipase L1-like esterase